MTFFKALLCFVLSWAPLQSFGFCLDSEIADMLENGAVTRTGEDEKNGTWFLSVGTAAFDGNNEKKALILAETDAKKTLAAFLSQTVTASSSYAYGENDGATEERFSASVRSRVDSMLKGVRIVRREIREGRAIAAALFSEKTIDAAKLLSDKVSQENCIEAFGEGSAFEDALTDACRNALSQAFGYSMVAADTVSENDRVRSRVFSDIRGNVSSYRILEQKNQGGRYFVRIVAEVDGNELRESYGAQMKSFGDPLFFLEAENEEAKSLLSDWFIGKGFKIAGTATDADYKIEIKTDFSSVRHPANGKAGTQLIMKIFAYDKAGVRLFSVQNDPRKAASFVGAAVRQRQIAVEKSVEQIESSLHKRIQSAVNDMVNNGRTVRIVFRGVKTPEQLRLIESLCETIAEIPNASVATYAHNSQTESVTVRFVLKGNVSDFAANLKESCPDLPPALSVTQNKIVFELPRF